MVADVALKAQLQAETCREEGAASDYPCERYDQMITAAQQGALLDTMVTGQDQCRSFNATIADDASGVGQHRHRVDANGKQAHSALIDGPPVTATDVDLHQVRVTVTGDIDLNVNVSVAPYVFLEFRGQDDDRPLAGMTVEILDDGGELVGSGLTDLTGGVFVTDLPEGELTADVDDPLDLHGASAFSTAATSTTEPPLDVITDVGPDSTHADGIARVLTNGFAQGFEDGTFRTRQEVTRGQLATLLVGALDLEPASPEFSDVGRSSTHASAISAAAAAGIVEGLRDDTFRPEVANSREQEASMLYRALADR